MAITKVRDNGTGAYSGAAVGSQAFTLANAYSAGDFIGVWVLTVGATVSGVSDNLGNTYASIATMADASTVRLTLFACYAAVAGTPTITTTFSATVGNAVVNVSEWSGVGAAVDKTGTAAQTTANPVTAATTAATTSANELVLLGWEVYTNPVQAQTASTPAGYTALPAANTAPTGNNFYLFPFYKLVSATGAMGGESSTLGFAPHDTASVIATFAALPDPFPAGAQPHPRQYLRL